MLKRNCLKCIWFTEENRCCNYTFRQIYQNDVCLEAERCPKYYERISIPKTEFRPLDLMEDYKNIVDKIKEHIKTELKKRYDDIFFEDYDCYRLINCFINDEILCHISLENKSISIKCFNAVKYNDADTENVETFEELFKYIDDVISEYFL